MTLTSEDLLAISDLLDVKLRTELQPLKEDVSLLKDKVNVLTDDVSSLKEDTGILQDACVFFE